MKKSERNFKIIDLYMDGESLMNISRAFNLHRTAVQRILKKNGVNLRKKTSCLKCDRSFFSKFTKESCYWAGFIMADGYIRKDRNTLHIKLKKLDKIHLEKFLTCMDIHENIIKESKDYCYINISFDKIKNDIKNNFEIGPNKTKNTVLPKKIPSEYISHFIRGYFDGDGSVTFQKLKNGKIYPVFSFVGRFELLDIFRKTLQKEAFLKIRNDENLPKITKYDNYGSIRYFGFYNANNFYKWIYFDSEDKIEMTRKKEKLIQLIS